MVHLYSLLAFAAIAYVPVNSVELDTTNINSIRSASATLAKGVVSYYNGNNTGEAPGTLVSPYYWWLGGAMFDSLAQYYDLTRDDQYNAILSQALNHQKGEDNFMPRNQTKDEGNDDQATWALAGLSAAELQITTGNTSYLTIAESVFNQLVLRWDEATCGGGLRWQIFSFNVGYEFKNTASNGNFFQLAARLAQTTGNTTYMEWATKVFEWTQRSGFMDDTWNVYEGAMVGDDCEKLNRVQYTATAGAYTAGAASMFNATGGDATWKSRLDGLLDRSVQLFFPEGIATEVACESVERCTIDTSAYKGVFARQLVDTVKAAPYTADRLRPLLTKSAEGAAAACDATGVQCGLRWNSTSHDNFGLGQSLGALGFVQSLLLWDESRNVPVNAGNATNSGTPTSGSSTNPTGSNSATTTPASGASLFSSGRMGSMIAGALAFVMFVVM